MTHDATRSYWVAGYALATQSAFPTFRLTSSLYLNILRAFESHTWVRRRTDSVFTVDVRTTQFGNSVVSRRLAEALSEMPPDVDVCIIDLRPAILASTIELVYPRAFAALADQIALASASAQFAGTHILVIVPQLGTRDDFHFRRFHELAERGAVTIMDQTGGLWSTRFAATSLGRLGARLGEPPSDAANALEAKLIRRLGLFPRIGENGQVEGYTRYSFDGRYCTDELSLLLGDALRKLLSPEHESIVVYDGDIAPWLAAPLVSAIADVSADPSSKLRSLSLRDLADDPSGPAVRTVIVLLPVVDRGIALSGLVKRAADWAPAALITGLCVVSIGEVRPERRMRRTLAVGPPIELHYLVAARQVAVRPHTLAPDIGYYESHHAMADRFLPLTSGDFWELVSEAGFVKERDTPARRSGLEYVPDLLQLIRANGPWLAYKIECAIELLAHRTPVNVSIALVAEEVAATRLADVVAATLGNAPLKVPRQYLADWEARQDDGQSLLRAWRESGAEWLLDADGASARVVVLLDEFAYSGGTLATMTSLFEALGFQVALVLALVAFSRAAFDEALREVPHFAFYATEWRTPHTRQHIEQSAA